MEKVEQTVKKVDDFLAKYPSVTQFGKWRDPVFIDSICTVSVNCRLSVAAKAFVRSRGFSYWTYE